MSVSIKPLVSKTRKLTKKEKESIVIAIIFAIAIPLLGLGSASVIISLVSFFGS